MQWTWAFSLVQSMLLVIFAMAITNNYNSVDGLRCFSCLNPVEYDDNPDDPALIAPACKRGDKNTLLAANLSVECESNMKFCLIDIEIEKKISFIRRRGCSTGSMATTRYIMQYACQTDNCNWFSENETESASKDKGSGLVRSDTRDSDLGSFPDQQRPETCLHCDGDDCSQQTVSLEQQNCADDAIFCYTHFEDNKVTHRGCGRTEYALWPNKYSCRTNNCNNWTTLEEAVTASKVPGGGVIDGQSARRSYLNQYYSHLAFREDDGP